MQIRLFALTGALLVIGIGGASAQSKDDHHPTVHAAQRYTARKLNHATNAVVYAPNHYRHWKKKKGHQIRAWLNKH